MDDEIKSIYIKILKLFEMQKENHKILKNLADKVIRLDNNIYTLELKYHEDYLGEVEYKSCIPQKINANKED